MKRVLADDVMVVEVKVFGPFGRIGSRQHLGKLFGAVEQRIVESVRNRLLLVVVLNKLRVSFE